LIIYSHPAGSRDDAKASSDKRSVDGLLEVDTVWKYPRVDPLLSSSDMAM
jgi:hypothetical protein